MTVLVAFMSDDFAFLASDRRLTRLRDDDTLEVAEDHRCKTVVWNGSLVIGYTGLAYVGADRTDDWLVKVLAVSDPLRVLEDAATAEFERPWALAIEPAARSTAFACLGWANGGPFLATISNCYDTNGQLLDRPLDAFETRAYELPPSRASELLVFGAPATDPGWLDLRDDVEHQVRTHREHGQLVADVVAGIRHITRDEDSVGSNVLVTVLPSPLHRDRDATYAVTTDVKSLAGVSIQLWSNGTAGPDTVIPGLTAPASPVLLFGDGYSSQFDSVIRLEENRVTVGVRWPLWLPFIDSEQLELWVYPVAGAAGQYGTCVASSWDRFPKMYASSDDDRPIVPRSVSTLGGLRAVFDDFAPISEIRFLLDDLDASLVAQREEMLDDLRQPVREIPDGTLSVLARNLLRNRLPRKI